MNLNIDICRVIDSKDATGPALHAVLVDQPEFTKLAPLAEFVSCRRINWQQSFARKGLVEKDYVLDEAEDMSYTFGRLDVTKTMIPERVKFRLPSVESPVSDLVTFEVQELRLSFDLQSQFSSPVAKDVARRYKKGFSFISDFSKALDVKADIAASWRDFFRKNALDLWDNERSFLRVRLSR
jgi:hypothetical protein